MRMVNYKVRKDDGTTFETTSYATAVREGKIIKTFPKEISEDDFNIRRFGLEKPNPKAVAEKRKTFIGKVNAYLFKR